MSSTLRKLKDFIAFALICGFPPFANADDNVSVGRINLKCERHNASAPPWTNSIQASKPICTENAKDIKAKQEEHAQRIKRSGEVTQKAAASQVASGKDLASFVSSIKSIYKGGIHEYENLAEQSKKAADELKKKQPQNEEAIRNMQAELRKVEGDQRQKIVEIEKIKLSIRREMADTATAQTVHNLDSLNSQKSQREKEKEPIDKVLSEKYHLRAVEEQSHVVTASKSMESVLREAQRNFLAKRDDLNSKLAKVDAIKTDSGVSGDEKEKTEKLAKDLEATPKISPKKYEDSALSKGLDKTKDWLYSPVDPTVAAKKDEMTESLKAASEPGTETTANKATKDALTLDGPTTGEGANRKLVAAGYDAAQDGDIKTSSPDAPIQQRIVEANEGLADKNLAAQDADMEAKGGAKGVRSEAEDTIKKVQEADKKIEQTARGMPMDSGAFSKGTVDKLDESSPYYEKQKQLKDDIENRNKIVEEACSSPSVCRAVTNVAGVKREVSTSDLAVQGVGVRSAAERQNDEMYKLNDNAGIGLKQISKPSAEKAIEEDHAQSITAARSAVEESQKRATDLTSSSAATERMKDTEVSLTRVHSNLDKVESQQNEFITTNAVAAGAVLKNSNGDQATTDKINDALRAEDSHNRTMGGVAGMLPGAAGYEAYKASGDADNVAAQVPLAGNSLKASQAASEADKEYQGKFNNAVVSAGMAAAPGGSMTGELAAKGATSLAEHSGFKAAESVAARTVTSDVERVSVREAESAGNRIAETRVSEPAPAPRVESAAPVYEAPHTQPAPARAAEVEEAAVPAPKEPAHVASVEPAREIPEPKTVEPHEAPAPAPREIAKAEPIPREAPTQKPLARAEETAPKAEPIRQDNSPYAPKNTAPPVPERPARVAQVEEEAPVPIVRVHQSEPAPSAAVSRQAPAEEAVAESASDARRTQPLDFSTGSSPSRSPSAPRNSQPRIASRPASASAPSPVPSMLRQDNSLSAASRSGNMNEVSSPAAARREIAVAEQPREALVSEVQRPVSRNVPNSARAEPSVQKTQNNTIARVEQSNPGRQPATFSQDNFPKSSPARAEASAAAKNSNTAEAELAAINKSQPHGVEMPAAAGSAPTQRPSYDSSGDSLRTRVADSSESAASADKKIAASEGEDKGFFQRQKERISDMGSKLKEKITGPSEEPSKWKVVSSEKESSSKWKPADDTPSRPLDRPLSEVPKDHPSNDQVALLNKLEEGHDVKIGTLDKDSKTRGNWVKEDHQINLNENLFGKEEKIQAKSTVVHESVHMTTDVKNIAERQSWFLSDSERVYGDKKLGSYSKQAKADEVEARVSQLASYRLDRQRVEQKLVTAAGAERKALKAEIEKIKKMEKITLNRARIMIARERELTLGALRTLDDPMKAMGVTKPKLIPAKDSFVYRFTDEEGRSQVYRDLLPQHKNLSVAEARSARSRDIAGLVKKEFGQDSAAFKGLYKIDGKPGSPFINLKRDAVKERTVRSYELSTGVDDVKMIGYLDASKPASREAAAEIFERRLGQLDAREAHLEKHYGLDTKKYDFGSTYGESKTVVSSEKHPGKLTPKSEDEFVKEIEAMEKQAAGSRPWAEEPAKANTSPFADRMDSIYKQEPISIREPAGTRDPSPKKQFLSREHSSFAAISAEDNKSFIKLAEKVNAGDASQVKRAATMQAAVGKSLNDVVIKNKDRVNEVFNLQKDLIWSKVSGDPLLSKHLVGQYSDFNTVKLAFDSSNPAIDKRLSAIFTEYNKRYSDFLDSVGRAEGWDKKAMGLAEKRENWHHLGIGNTPDEANLAARKSREMLDENGLSRPRTYEEVKSSVQDDLQAIEKRRVELANKFSSTEGMFVGKKGEQVLSAEASEAIRKAEQTDVAIKKTLEHQFSTRLTDSEVTAFRDYVAKADSFSPDLYVAERIDVPLDARRNGIVSADFKGQNARNLEETMKAMVGTRGKAIEEQVRAIRSGEAKATEMLESKKADFRQAIEKQFAAKDPDFAKHIYFTGDDGIYLPAKKLTAEDKASLATKFSEKPDNLRLTYGQSHFADNGKAIPREALHGEKALSDFVVDAEKVEKDMRKGLMNEFKRDITNDTQIVVDMTPRSDGTKSIGVYVGGRHSAEQMGEIKTWAHNFLKERGDDLSFVKELGEPKLSRSLASAATSSSDLEALRKIAPDLKKDFSNSHQVRIENGKGYVKIGKLEKENDGPFMKSLVKAIKNGDIAEINAGGVAGPKVLNMLTRVGDIAPKGSNMIVKGKIDVGTIEQIYAIERKLSKDPAAAGWTLKDLKREGHYWTEQDVADFQAAKEKLRLQEACAEQLGVSSLAKCGQITFQIKSSDSAVPASSVASKGGSGAGLTMVTDLKTGNSAVIAPNGAQLVKEASAPTSIEGKRERWLSSGDSMSYDESVAPAEAKAEFARLAKLKDPAAMPASPGAAYYQQQINYTQGQLALVSNLDKEDLFGGLETVLEKTKPQLEKELKAYQQAMQNARAQGRP